MKNLIVLVLLTLVISTITNEVKGGPKPPKDDFLITVTTALGTFKIILYDNTPEHKASFSKMVKSGYFTGKSFYKMLPGQLIQGGNSEPSTPTIAGEIANPHKKGALASLGVIDPLSGAKTSYADKFYIVINEKGLTHFNKSYTVFGEVIEGMDVIDKIASSDLNEDFNFKTPVSLTVTGTSMKRKKITKLTGYKYPTNE